MATEENRTQLQLITWNDFGEGTMIEPTQEFQYLFLEKLQAFTGLPYSKTILEQILQYYTLKKQFANHPEKQKQLQQAFYYLISLQHNKAMELISDSVTIFSATRQTIRCSSVNIKGLTSVAVNTGMVF